jgi:nicotinamidase-related amidase
MQNDFVRAGAPLEVPDARLTIAATLRLLEAFRSRRLPVLYTRFLSLEADNLFWRWSPECHPATRACWPGHLRGYDDAPEPRPCADVIDELAPEPGEPIVDKLGYGAFHGTDLDVRLRALGVRSLVVTGTVTQICVEETAREAFHHGYATTVVADAVSSFAPDLHAASLRNLAMKFGWVADADEVIAALAVAVPRG